MRMTPKDIVREDPLRAMMIEKPAFTLEEWLAATTHLDPKVVRETFASVTPEVVAEARNAGGIRW